MKRMFIAAVAALALLTVAPQAASAKQGFIVKGGLTYTKLDVNNLKGYTGFNAGFGYQYNIGYGFSVQPEIDYNLKGSQIDANTNWKRSFVEVPVNIQWGPDLVVCRPYLEVSPFIGYNIANTTGKISSTSTASDIATILNDNAKKIEYGVGLGAGIEIWKLQLSCKYIWNYGTVFNNSTSLPEQIASMSAASASGVVVCLGFIF
jgi:opacity protein-like surface antigen